MLNLYVGEGAERERVELAVVVAEHMELQVLTEPVGDKDDGRKKIVGVAQRMDDVPGHEADEFVLVLGERLQVIKAGDVTALHERERQVRTENIRIKGGETGDITHYYHIRLLDILELLKIIRCRCHKKGAFA